jgi:hypothetical protein
MSPDGELGLLRGNQPHRFGDRRSRPNDVNLGQLQRQFHGLCDMPGVLDDKNPCAFQDGRFRSRAVWLRQR